MRADQWRGINRITLNEDWALQFILADVLKDFFGQLAGYPLGIDLHSQLGSNGFKFIDRSKRGDFLANTI